MALKKVAPHPFRNPLHAPAHNPPVKAQITIMFVGTEIPPLRGGFLCNGEGEKEGGSFKWHNMSVGLNFFSRSHSFVCECMFNVFQWEREREELSNVFVLASVNM